MTLETVKHITRAACFVLALGFFYSCGSSKVNLDTLIDNGDYDQALMQVDKELEKNPENLDLYFYKASIQAKIAETLEVTDRDSIYTAFSETIEKSSNLSEPPAISIRLDSLRTEQWVFEYQSGLDLYEEGQQNYYEALAHFENALIIRNDKVETYKSLAVTQYKLGNIEEAISTLDAAKNIAELDLEIYENLGFLYLQQGNATQSVFYYNLAGQEILENKNIAFGLVNAYISDNNTNDALELLDDLTQAYPNDPKVHNVYGTLLFKQVPALFLDLESAYTNSDSLSVSNLKVEIEGLAEKAEHQLQKAYTINGQDIENMESLAVFYNNMSGGYFSVLDSSFELDKNSIEEKAIRLVGFAIDYYEKLVEIAPQNDLFRQKVQNLTTLKESRSNS